MVFFMKLSILLDISNNVKFHSYTCWLINDTQNHRLPCRVNDHHIDNESLFLLGHVEIGS